MQPVSVQESLLVAFSPKLEYLATGTRDGRLKAFDTGNFALKLLGPKHRDGLDSLISVFERKCWPTSTATYHPPPTFWSLTSTFFGSNRTICYRHWLHLGPGAMSLLI